MSVFYQQFHILGQYLEGKDTKKSINCLYLITFFYNFAVFLLLPITYYDVQITASHTMFYAFR